MKNSEEIAQNWRNLMIWKKSGKFGEKVRKTGHSFGKENHHSISEVIHQLNSEDFRSVLKKNISKIQSFTHEVKKTTERPKCIPRARMLAVGWGKTPSCLGAENHYASVMRTDSSIHACNVLVLWISGLFAFFLMNTIHSKVKKSRNQKILW